MDHKQFKPLSVAPPLYPSQGDFTLDSFDRITIFGIIYVGKVAEVFTKYSLGRPIMFTDGFRLFLHLNPYNEVCVAHGVILHVVHHDEKGGFFFIPMGTHPTQETKSDHGCHHAA